MLFLNYFSLHNIVDNCRKFVNWPTAPTAPTAPSHAYFVTCHGVAHLVYVMCTVITSTICTITSTQQTWGQIHLNVFKYKYF